MQTLVLLQRSSSSAQHSKVWIGLEVAVSRAVKHRLSSPYPPSCNASTSSSRMPLLLLCSA